MSDSEVFYEIIECNDVFYTVNEVGTDGIQVEHYQEVGNNKKFKTTSSELDLKEALPSTENMKFLVYREHQNPKLKKGFESLNQQQDLHQHFKYQKIQLEEANLQSSKSMCCKICKINFVSYTTYLEHYSIKHRNIIEILCKKCKTFYSLDVIKDHREVCNGKLNEKLLKKLQWKNPRESLLATNMKVHDHVKIYYNLFGTLKMQCRRCKQGKYTYDYGLVRHLLNRHHIKTKYCPYCSALSEEAELQSHIKECHGDKNVFNCEKCGAEFSKENLLTLHYEMYGRKEGSCRDVIEVIEH